MTWEYGVVFEQEKHDLIAEMNLDDDVVISNLRLVTYSKKLRSLFEPILTDFINGRGG